MTNDDRSTVDDWVHLPPAELVVSVGVAPAPEIALASLRPLLTPLRDDDGALIDWTIDLSEVFDRDPEESIVSEFRSWRRTWCHEWPIGPITNIVSLRQAVAGVEHDLERHLDALLERVVAADGTDVTVDPHIADAIGRELETVRLALAVDQRAGVGLIDDMPTRTRSSGLARAWVPPADEMVLAATPRTSVLIHPDDGLVIVHGETDSATTFAGVTAVDMRADTVLIMNDRGSSLRLTQADARPLGWIVPRSLRWHVRPVPLVAVWTLLFEGLGTALRVSAERGAPMHIDGGPMIDRANLDTDFPGG
jgi:hypothetical protein